MKPKFNPRTLVFLLLIFAGGWFLFHRQEIRNVSDAWQIASRQIRSLGGGSANLIQAVSGEAPGSKPNPAGVVRIASFNLHNYGSAKSKRTHVMESYAKIIRQFDLVAIQGIRTDDSNVIAALLDEVNRDGAHYGILTSPRLGRLVPPLQYAFLFDTRRIQPVDKPYVVADPEGLLQRPPFVGWFRAIGPAPEAAFTFSLVNWLVEAPVADKETMHVAKLLDAVRRDGRGEDDVIVAGTLQIADEELTPLLAGTTYQWLVRSVPTVTEGDWQLDNFIIDSPATVEFTGRSGSFDFLREFNFNVAQSLEISEHLPIWAEFFPEEGRASGLVATETAIIVPPGVVETR